MALGDKTQSANTPLALWPGNHTTVLQFNRAPASHFCCGCLQGCTMQEMEALEVLPAATLSKRQPCRKKLELEDALPSLTDICNLSPDLAPLRLDGHCPTL